MTERTWEQANHEQLQAVVQRLDALNAQVAQTNRSVDVIRSNVVWLLVVVVVVVLLAAAQVVAAG